MESLTGSGDYAKNNQELLIPEVEAYYLILAFRVYSHTLPRSEDEYLEAMLGQMESNYYKKGKLIFSMPTPQVAVEHTEIFIEALNEYKDQYDKTQAWLGMQGLDLPKPLKARWRFDPRETIKGLLEVFTEINVKAQTDIFLTKMRDELDGSQDG